MSTVLQRTLQKLKSHQAAAEMQQTPTAIPALSGTLSYTKLWELYYY